MMQTHERLPKEPLAHLPPDYNGVTRDYMNEYSGLDMALGWQGFGEVLRMLREQPVKLYEERYSPRQWRDMVTDENRVTVERIDACARRVNSGASDGSLTCSEFMRIRGELSEIFFGKRASEHDYHKVVPGYMSEYSGIDTVLRWRGFEEMLGAVREHRIKLYEERYPGMVTGENRAIVERIDECARRVNSGAADGSLTDDEYRRIRGQLSEIFAGGEAL